MTDTYNSLPPQPDAPLPPYYGRDAQNSYYDQQDNLAKMRMDVEQEIRNFRHALEGKELMDVNYKDDKTGKIFTKKEWVTVIDESENTLNSFGVSLMMNIISPEMRKTTTLSYWEPEEIDRNMEEWTEVLSDIIAFNAEKMGINTDEKIARIGALMTQAYMKIASSYKRARNGREGSHLAPQWNITENLTPNIPVSSPSPKRFNFGGKWGKKGY